MGGRAQNIHIFFEEEQKQCHKMSFELVKIWQIYDGKNTENAKR